MLHFVSYINVFMFVFVWMSYFIIDQHTCQPIYISIVVCLSIYLSVKLSICHCNLKHTHTHSHTCLLFLSLPLYLSSALFPLLSAPIVSVAVIPDTCSQRYRLSTVSVLSTVGRHEPNWTFPVNPNWTKWSFIFSVLVGFVFLLLAFCHLQCLLLLKSRYIFFSLSKFVMLFLVKVC